MDWEQIVSEYADLLARTTHGPLIRNVTELPYPREVVRAAIMQCLAAEKLAPSREALKTCYLGLAAYQHLTPEEREAVRIVSSKPFANLFPGKVDPEVSEAMPAYKKVVLRFSGDKDAFAADLRTMAAPE